MDREQIIRDRLCHCPGSERYKPLVNAEKMPLAGGRHTSFMLLGCLACDKPYGFPQDNLLLFLREGPDTEVDLFVKSFLWERQVDA